jgi:hypothetical protein
MIFADYTRTIRKVAVPVTPPANEHSDSSPKGKRVSIFAHDYPVPVAMVLTAITYAATLALPYRFIWTSANAFPFISAHGHSVQNHLVMPSDLIVVVLAIPMIFFFILEFTVMRSYPPVSRTAKILFISGIIVSSVLVGLISPPFSLQ